jgi:hypothetical protein
MVNVTKLKNGDSVHYAPEHYKKDNKFENGVVKSISPNGGVFVVYNCGGEWHKFMDYTAANTNPKDLFLGWKE